MARKSILIMYWHGLGDLLCLTPQLRYLHGNRWAIDLLVRPQVLSSHLLDACPYTRKVLPLPFIEGGPAEGGASGKEKKDACNEMYDSLSPRYKKAAKIVSLHDSFRHRGGKINRNSRALFYDRAARTGLLKLSPPSDYELEVFISDRAEEAAKEYIAKNYPDGFIFKHTTPAYHPAHNWDPSPWISKNLPNLPVFEADFSPSEDINFAFVMAREATHRVLSSSVFVHACDAMNVVMDVVHYGKPNPHGLPLDANKIKVYHGKGSENRESL